MYIIYLYSYRGIYLSIYLSVYLFIYIAIYLSIYLFNYLPIYLCDCVRACVRVRVVHHGAPAAIPLVAGRVTKSAPRRHGSEHPSPRQFPPGGRALFARGRRGEGAGLARVRG